MKGRSSDSVHDFPSGIVHTIAEQVGCASVSPENYPFQGRQAQRHRQSRCINPRGAGQFGNNGASGSG
ncbi:hypothetical protein D1220_27895 (plasmid) [Klebsiella pneumoniae]|nr:hypothetical protein D9K64_26670 [Klebsiella pneumoniae]RLO14388.1 hypothetical protein D1220_27895 [Klebsiella pneumoniae]